MRNEIISAVGINCNVVIDIDRSLHYRELYGSFLKKILKLYFRPCRMVNNVWRGNKNEDKCDKDLERLVFKIILEEQHEPERNQH